MRFLVLLPVILLAPVCAASATQQRAAVHGVVMRGPVTPFCTAEQPCDEPASGVTLVFLRGGTALARAVTGVDGGYRVRLAAGVYTVRRASVAGRDRRLEPNRVSIHGGAMRLDFSIDTGIR